MIFLSNQYLQVTCYNIVFMSSKIRNRILTRAVCTGNQSKAQSIFIYNQARIYCPHLKKLRSVQFRFIFPGQAAIISGNFLEHTHISNLNYSFNISIKCHREWHYQVCLHLSYYVIFKTPEQRSSPGKSSSPISLQPILIKTSTSLYFIQLKKI